MLSHIAKSLKTDGRCWNLEGHASSLEPHQELWKAQEPHFPKWKKDNKISVEGDKVNPYKVSNRDEKFQKRGRRLWRKKCSKCAR